MLFEVANSSEGTAMKDPAGNAIKVEISISNYSYANLQTTSYVFPQTNAITPALFQEYTLGSFAYKPITGITNSKRRRIWFYRILSRKLWRKSHNGDI